MSAVLVCAARSLVPVWHSVTVAFSVRRVSSRPRARPTVIPRPMTVTSAPAMPPRSGAAVRDAARRARQRAGLAEHQLAEVDRVQPVRVLGRIHPVEHGVGVQPGRQRQLDDVPGAGRIGVQFVDHRLHLRLGRVGGQVPPDGRDPDLRAVPVLAVHVGAAAGIVADQDRAEPGHGAGRAACGGGSARGQRGHPLRQAGPYFRGQGLAVKHLCGHAPSFRVSGKSAGRR